MSAGLPPCEITPSDGHSLQAKYPYPADINSDHATIRVRYVVDEQGKTVDAEVEVVEEGTTAQQRRFREMFEYAAVEAVKSWTFAFADPNDNSCCKRQTRTTSLQYRY